MIQYYESIYGKNKWWSGLRGTSPENLQSIYSPAAFLKAASDFENCSDDERDRIIDFLEDSELRGCY